MRRRNTEEDFWQKVQKTDTCWLWTAGKDNYGYGVFAMNGKRRAHRYSWQLHNGPIPAGLLVLHTCDVPACVNPSHLFLGTDATNATDKASKGRCNAPRGVATNHAKLTDEIVREIRARYEQGGITHAQLAKDHGIAASNSWLIVHRKAWKHVE